MELRPWRVDDAEQLVALAAAPDLAAQFGGAPPMTTAAAARFISDVLRTDDETRSWAVTENGSPVGHVGLSAIERHHETAWVSYWLAPHVRGRGLAVRALASVTDWADDSGLVRLELGHRANNPASCRVAAGAGFLVEGFERQKLRYGAERFDVELHARLRTDLRSPAERLPLSE